MARQNYFVNLIQLFKSSAALTPLQQEVLEAFNTSTFISPATKMYATRGMTYEAISSTLNDGCSPSGITSRIGRDIKALKDTLGDTPTLDLSSDEDMARFILAISDKCPTVVPPVQVDPVSNITVQLPIPNEAFYNDRLTSLENMIATLISDNKVYREKSDIALQTALSTIETLSNASVPPVFNIQVNNYLDTSRNYIEHKLQSSNKNRSSFDNRMNFVLHSIKLVASLLSKSIVDMQSTRYNAIAMYNECLEGFAVIESRSDELRGVPLEDIKTALREAASNY